MGNARRPFAAPIDQKYGRSVGGMFVCTPETYWSLGGMDELFIPYGDTRTTLSVMRLRPSSVCVANRRAVLLQPQRQSVSEDNESKPSCFVPLRARQAHGDAGVDQAMKIGIVAHESRITRALKALSRHPRRPTLPDDGSLGCEGKPPYGVGNTGKRGVR